MVDLPLMDALLRALPPSARLVLVGDADQLPSVGPGNVFSAIIRSQVVQTVRLTEIFRQKADSRIVRNAHMINRGEHPDLSENAGDFFRLKRLQGGSTAETITELCAVRLPGKMHIPPEDIQVLSPTRKGELGTINLNRSLQQALNPARQDKAEKLYGDTVFRVGDRVMQVRNNYDIIWQTVDGKTSGTGIYNGDIGYIRKLDAVNESLEIDFDGKLALYSFTNLNELDHAWAVTVHKAQGCEFRAVVFALSASSRMLMTRSVLYTGITRAKELLILVGDENVAFRMIDNQRRDPRFTFLKTRILAAAGGSEGNIRP
jgi:exodeoxyribonuclease V alpha subunit